MGAKSKNSPVQSLQGHLLVASPQLLDPNFAHAVVFMIQHNDEGAMGLILNRPLQSTIAQIWEQVSDTPCNGSELLHQGGPCEGPLMILHTHADQAQISVADGIYFTTEEENARWLVENHMGLIKYFAGYSGWAPKQLESELRTGSWLTAQASPQLVLGDQEGDDLWFHVLDAIDPTWATLVRNPKLIPPDPSVN